MSRFDATRYPAAPLVALSNRQWPDRRLEKAPRWVSVDLRDGNQALLEPMSVAQKRRLWKLLIEVGFKEIEVGFPAASQPDFDFVRWLIEERQIPDDVSIQVLVQARKALIERTFAALEGAPRAIVHLYNSTSPVQRERVFGLDCEGVKAIAVRGAQWVKDEALRHPDTDWRFQYSPESFTHTEMDFAVVICEAVLDVWQPTPERPVIINLPSTVEAASPNVFADQIEYFATHIDRRDSLVLSVHTHNDRGGAVASAELALLAGAERVEGTLLGNGERTGNMDIVTLGFNLYSQGIDPELDLSNPARIVRTVSECTSLPVHPRHPWVGELVYTAFSGSHQDAIRKCLAQQREDEPWQVAYLPIDPRDIGRDYQAVIRVNSQSGKGGVAFVLERDHGLRLPRWMQIQLAAHVQEESERRGGEVEASRIRLLFEEQFLPAAQTPRVSAYHLDQTGGVQRLQVRLEATEKPLEGQGEGVLDAFIDAINRQDGPRVDVLDYSEHALESGADAHAVAYVQLAVNGQPQAGAAIARDTLSAALQAVLSAYSRAA
ncbi:MAG: 2-isopropylmalate synthase [Halothiobacillaceae bacterium]|nr:2-isopropylmalate synthase [Halothiobacillaceae bacterium]